MLLSTPLAKLLQTVVIAVTSAQSPFSFHFAQRTYAFICSIKKKEKKGIVQTTTKLTTVENTM